MQLVYLVITYRISGQTVSSARRCKPVLDVINKAPIHRQFLTQEHFKYDTHVSQLSLDHSSVFWKDLPVSHRTHKKNGVEINYNE
jgi:hypothetical protein